MAKSSNAATPKNFEFIIQQQFGGYVSSIDKTKAAPNLMVKGSQNIYKKLNGNLGIREGLKRRGVANSAIYPITSEFVWNNSAGGEITMVVSDGDVYAVIDDVWYLLKTGTSTRLVFSSWYDTSLAYDKLLWVDGTHNMYSWTGGFGKISSTTSNSITLDAVPLRFSTSGILSVIINGNTYTYTGISSNTLTGVSPDPTGEANGSGVLMSPITHTDTPASGFNSDFIKVINNQAWVGSYSSRVVYISANDDFTDYTVPTPRLPGSPELLTLDGAAKGITIRNGNGWVGFGNSSWAEVIFNNITVGTDLTQSTQVNIQPVADGQAPYAHEFIDKVGDNIVYLAQDQQVRVIGSANNAFNTVFPSISQEVATELSAENFTGGNLRAIGEFIYLTAPNSGKTYLRQERTRLDENGQVFAERLWHSPFILSASRIDFINNEVIVFSNANPQIYNLWNTGQYYDDSPSDEPLPYQGVLAFAYWGKERRQGLFSFDKIFTEGYLTPNSSLKLTINYDYLGSSAVQEQFINDESYPAYFFRSSSSSLGDESLGRTSLGLGGGEDEEDNIYNFKTINQFSLTNCFNWQLVYSSDEINANWEILAVGSDARVESEQDATFIINKQ